MIAYIDPGSGAMLLQWIIAGVIGSGLFFRRAIVGFFRKLFRMKDKTVEEDKPDSAPQPNNESQKPDQI